MKNLDKINLFIGAKSELLREVLSEDWKTFDCFNDYKIVFINKTINKSIIVKISYPEADLAETINDIWLIDYLYSES